MKNQPFVASLQDFTILNLIGKGSYADVYLGMKNSEGHLYALKSFKKKLLTRQKEIDRILMERKILMQLDHPFLARLNACFQDEERLFIALDYYAGGELFNLLLKKKTLDENETRFYCAQIILALEYLHEKNIIYRDLKPQNILIDEGGYLKLTDFGLSKDQVFSKNQTFSICGTPQYLAPQMIKGEGYGKAVDYWCLGCIIYELLYGYPPFLEQNRDKLFHKIKYEHPEFPQKWSSNVRNLLNVLLTKDPVQRLKNFRKIKSHPWFNGLNWNKLLLKEIDPPFIPKIKGKYDLRNFDKEFTECEISQFHSGMDEENYFDGFSFNVSMADEESYFSTQMQ